MGFRGLLTGWRGLAAACLAVGLILAFAAVTLEASGATRTLLAALGVFAWAATVAAWTAGRTADWRARNEKLSREMTLLSERLLRLEGVPAAMAVAPAAVDPDVATDLRSLSGIVTKLADALADQDARLRQLDRRVDARDEAKDGANPPGNALGEAPWIDSPPILATPDEPPAAVEPAVESPATAETRPIGLEDIPLLRALERGAIELHLQPAVTLPQRRPHIYEALARLRLADGALVPAAAFVPLFERLELMPRLDTAVLEEALVLADRLAIREGLAVVAVNLSTASLTHRRAMEMLERRLAERPALAARIVVERAQAAWAERDPVVDAALASLKARGVRLSIDHVQDWSADWSELARQGVAFVKVPAADLLASGAGETLPARLAGAGLQLIAEKVEDERIVPDLIELDVPFAQGYALEAPRAIRPASQDAADGPAAPDRGPDAVAAPGAAAPLSYRDYLRRAG